MMVSGDYANPVSVNGYSCHNCSDVDYAKKHIDPAHPKDGPYGIDARPKPGEDRAPAVTFGGLLAALAVNAAAPAPPTATPAMLDISA